MTAVQKDFLLSLLDELYNDITPVKLQNTLKTAHDLIDGNSHDYSVLGFVGEINMHSTPVFEFNTNCLSDAKDMFKYWAKRMRKDGTLILQDNHEFDSYIDIQYGSKD